MVQRVLITGAAGFIGMHLALKLAKEGVSVLGYDNFNSYYATELKEQRKQKLGDVGIDVITGDICDTSLLHQVCQRFSPSHIVHLAAQAGVRYSITHPQEYVTANLQGFVSLLEVCKHFPQVPLVYASSSSVYGTNEKVPFSESDPTNHPANLYGATKKANELLAYAYHNMYHIPMTALRFFTVYGPWGRPDMAYYSFTKCLFEEQPIRLYNWGKMWRDFTYIDDIVHGIIAALEKSYPWEIFNLGNHRSEELSHFISVLEQATGKKANLQLLPMQQGEIEATFADIEHSKDKLGYHPQTTLEVGLPRFVEWYRTYHL